MPLKMKISTGLFTMFLVTTLVQAQESKQEVLLRENQLWQTLIGHRPDFSAFKRFLAPGYIQMDNTGAVMTTEDSVAELKTCTVGSFKISNPDVRPLSPESTLIVYRVTLDATCGGEKIPSELESADVWVRGSSQWLLQLHTETRVLISK
jgi:hypothetical protein